MRDRIILFMFAAWGSSLGFVGGAVAAAWLYRALGRWSRHGGGQ